MIIENQNASQLLLCAIYRRQAPRLINDENLSSTTARLFDRSRQAKQAGTGGGPNEWRRDRSMAKAFPFHALTLCGAPRGCHGACGGFITHPHGAFAVPSFDRANQPRERLAPSHGWDHA